MEKRSLLHRVAVGVAVLGLGAIVALPAQAGKRRQQKRLLATLFTPSGQCVTCHNNLVTPSGQDVSIGTDWSASMMANSARDPYWHAAVRRETLEHPTASAAIQDECSKCHMPAARFLAHETGTHGGVFANLPIGQSPAPRAALAADGVTCSVCHQIGPEKLGSRESFVGGFVIEPRLGRGQRPVYGPYDVNRGRALVMSSSSGFTPRKGDHVRRSELCATCHTLYTHSLGPNGDVVGELAEQVPYLEWKHSSYPAEHKSCQSCHLPRLGETTAISSVLPQPRDKMAPHVFRGGNFFMIRVLGRHRRELGVAASPRDLSTTAQRTLENLQQRTARLFVEAHRMPEGRLRVDVTANNLTGHKLPTAYPSRRVWIHLKATDSAGHTVFESGALDQNGSIVGNDNDADPGRFEPHYAIIEATEQVQIYEPILGDPQGRVTTGLLTATQYLKDNRLLPRGFDKSTAEADCGVYGAAKDDTDFTDGSDHTRYLIDTGSAKAPFFIEVELWYQPVGFRWAMNMKPFQASEPQRFVRYYESMANAPAARLASSATRVAK